MKFHREENEIAYSLARQWETLRFEKPRPMVDQIYKVLGRAIAAGTLRPGRLLKETDLQEAFGVSRAPIREALRLLEADDLIVVDAYKKKYVRPITRQHLEDLAPVLACLEGIAASLAAKSIKREELELLKKKNADMQRALERKKYDLGFELNFDFHRVYVKASNNQVLIHALRSIKKAVIWFWVTNFYEENKDVAPAALSEHELIIEKIAEGDSSGAEAAARKHVTNVIERSIHAAFFDSEGFCVLPSGHKQKN